MPSPVETNNFRVATWAQRKPIRGWNKNTLLVAVPASALAVAALLLSLRSPVTADALVGGFSVLALLAVASLEYRINWKRLFGRS